jgi:hypothetical protein
MTSYWPENGGKWSSTSFPSPLVAAYQVLVQSWEVQTHVYSWSGSLIRTQHLVAHVVSLEQSWGCIDQVRGQVLMHRGQRLHHGTDKQIKLEHAIVDHPWCMIITTFGVTKLFVAPDLLNCVSGLHMARKLVSVWRCQLGNRSLYFTTVCYAGTLTFARYTSQGLGQMCR